MDREQHVIQDAAEFYAVYVMQKTAERLGAASTQSSESRLEEFLSYLLEGDLSRHDFSEGKYKQYKINADFQLPNFVQRVSYMHKHSRLNFENVEKEFRNRGLKGDFLLHVTGEDEPIPVSLKNYIGSGGITRPQVGSGTFASFAAGFVFERVGVGRYLNPITGDTFAGSNATERNKILANTGRADLVPILAVLDDLQAQVREEFLGPDCEYYDAARVKAAAQRVARAGISATLELFDRLGLDTVRQVFLTRSGLDGAEEALFFDADRYVDSITTHPYHELRERLNAPQTTLDIAEAGQGIRFTFSDDRGVVLQTDVPYTINTNGAWFRPKERFTGTQRYIDKGHPVDLVWGQRRPRKSKEIATSVNMYVDLARAGLFADS